jgi:hypothetical protein
MKWIKRRSAEREFAIPGPNRRSELLRNIQASLRCIEDGPSVLAPAVRSRQECLVAIPWTPFCMRCPRGRRSQ